MVIRQLDIEEWARSHPRWSELAALVVTLEQSRWLDVRYEWHRSSHLLVAQSGGEIIGFLRFVTQAIGADDDHELVQWAGEPLIEAKVLAFAVAPAYRRQGVGRALQTHALERAAQLGCYQLRSHSSGDNMANHHLKLSMGFAVQPVTRGHDRRGAYFIMPLRRS